MIAVSLTWKLCTSAVDIRTCAEIKKIKIFFSPYLTEEQTVSKWEKQLSVPDAETLMKIAEVLEVSVNDLLGEPIAERADMSDVAEQLSRLNDLVATQIQDRRNLGRKIKEAAIIALFILFIIAIYPSWGDMWHEFGRNLYHLLNN